MPISIVEIYFAKNYTIYIDMKNVARNGNPFFWNWTSLGLTIKVQIRKHGRLVWRNPTIYNSWAQTSNTLLDFSVNHNLQFYHCNKFKILATRFPNRLTYILSRYTEVFNSQRYAGDRIYGWFDLLPSRDKVLQHLQGGSDLCSSTLLIESCVRIIRSKH
jgi:hypothetical protein